MTEARRVLAALVTAVGIAIFVGVERGIRRSLHLLENELFVEPAFSAIVWAFAALGLFFIVFGAGAVGPNAQMRERFFVFVEAPLALVVGSFVAFWTNSFHLVGDVGPRNSIDLAQPVPPALILFVRPVLFYAVLAALLVVTVWLFNRRLRAVV